MEYEVISKREWMKIVLPAELDHLAAEQIREEVKLRMQEEYAKYIVFDFQKTTMMDSSGIGLITGRYRDVAVRGGQVYVSNVSSHMHKVLELSGLYRIVIPWEQVVTEMTI